MTLLGQYLGAIFATVKRDALIFTSYRLRIVSQILTMLFTLTLFHYIAKLMRADAVGSHSHYYAFVVVGIVGMTVLTSAITTSEIVRMELMQGNFERILISPLGPVGGVVSVAVFPIAYATMSAALMLTLAGAFFGVPVKWGGIPPALAVGTLGALALGCIGLMFVAGLLVYKSALGVTWVVAGFSLLGGVYFPMKLFPAWIQWTADVQPFTPAVDLLRHLLVGTPSLQPVWLEVLKIGAFTAVLMPASAAILWVAVHASRRRGTIMEF